MFAGPEEEAFSKEAIREIILSYVFKSQNGDLDNINDIRSSRLVSKSWLSTTSKILIEHGKPLFRVFLCDREPINGAKESSGDVLAEFLNTITRSNQTFKENIPLIQMKAYCEFFCEQNYSFFSEFLSLCGNNLINLSISFPKNGGSMPFLFTHLQLPKLQKLEVIFTNQILLHHEWNFASNRDTIYFVQNVLSAACNLTSIEFRTFGNLSGCQFRIAPPMLAYLQLPESITTLSLDYNVQNKDMELITTGHFKNLQHLQLQLPCKPLQNGIIFQILQHLSETVESITFFHDCFNCLLNEKSVLKFPKMKQLSKLSCQSLFLELDSEFESLETYLPTLRELELLKHNELMFRKWTETSNFNLVTKFSFHLIEKALEVETVNVMQQAFPKLLHLDLSFICNIKDIAPISSVFQKFNQLKFLRLNPHYLGTNIPPNCNFWDSLITGKPLHPIDGPNGGSEWFSIAKVKQEVPFSVKEMQELKEFKLDGIKEVHRSLISDRAFRFGFLKMPNLKKITLTGNYQASPEVVQEWITQGRTIQQDSEDSKICIVHL